MAKRKKMPEVPYCTYLNYDKFYYYHKHVHKDVTYYTRFACDGKTLTMFHNMDGPAIVRKTGEVEYYINGINYNKEEFDNLDSFFLNTV